MTIVCINAQRDRATIMNDSMASSSNGRVVEFDTAPKATMLPAITAAVTARGNTTLGEVWTDLSEYLAAEVDDFDEFAARIQDGALRRLIDAQLQVAANPIKAEYAGQFVAYLVGYSPREGRYRAFAAPWLTSPRFTLVDISDTMYVTPCPPGMQPTDIERLHNQRRGDAVMPPGRPAAVPTADAGWATLAKRIHRGRSVTTDYSRKLPTGGAVVLTRLEDGEVSQHTICTLDDPADFRVMFANSMHPVGQLSPCPCGSTRRLMDCCITADQPCNCGSGDLMGDCCMLDPDSAEAAEWIARYPDLARAGTTGQPARAGKTARNDPCPCGSGAKFKRCCALVGA